MSDPNAADPELYRAIAENAARENGVDPDLVMKVIQQESAGDPHAIGRLTKTGEKAHGLMQIMPANYADLGITDPFDVTQNVNGGTKFLKTLIDKYHGDTRLALIDYNGGPDAVAAYRAGKPFKESAGYVKNILGDSTRPDPMVSLDDFVKAHGTAAAPAAAQGDGLDDFVKQANKTQNESDIAGAVEEQLRAALPENVYDAAVGGLRGVGKSVVNLTGLPADKIEMGGRTLSSWLTPSNWKQKLAMGGEQAAEFAVPAMAADAAAMKVAGSAPAVVRLATRAAAQGAVGAGDAYVKGSSPVIGGIIGASGPLVGEAAAASIPWALKTLATATTRQALKPAYSILSKMGGFEGAEPNAEQLVRYIIDNKLANAADAEAMIRNLENNKILPIARAADARGAVTTAPADAQAALDAAIAKDRTSGLATNAAALERAKQRLATGPGSHAEDVTTMVPQAHPTLLGPNGKPLITLVPQTVRQPKASMGVEETLNSARGAATDAAYGTGVRPQGALLAAKTTEIAERNAAKAAAPELEPALAEQRLAINAKKVLDRGDVREGNRDMLPLTVATMIGKGATGDVMGVGWGILKAAGVKGGILADQLGNALQRGDVRAVGSLVRMMGYGAALDALPQQGVSNGQIPQ